jgi:DnaJ-class molecular chaperone
MTIILTCKRCKGTGVVPNERFEICKSLKSEEAKRHFRLHTETEEIEDEPEDAGVEAECGEPPTVACPQCDGEGVLEFDENEWDLLVVPEEDQDDGDA